MNRRGFVASLMGLVAAWVMPGRRRGTFEGVRLVKTQGPVEFAGKDAIITEMRFYSQLGFVDPSGLPPFGIPADALAAHLEEHRRIVTSPEYSLLQTPGPRP